MRELHRLTLTLSMENPEQKKAWEHITRIPKGHRTQYICSKIIAQQQEKEWEEIIYETVKQAVKDIGLSTTQYKELHTESKESGELKDNILGFIASLQKEGN